MAEKKELAAVPLGKAYYRPDEVARLLGIHRNTIYHHIKIGRLLACRFGKSVRIARQVLEQYLQEARTSE